MQIQIKNIGKIKEATVNLDGLSVVAGNNDTGKSTISKVVFSVIKAFQRYKEFSKSSKKKLLEKYSEDLYMNLRIQFNSEIHTFELLKKQFEPDIFLDELIKFNNKKEFFKRKNNFLINTKSNNEAIILLKNIEKEYFKEDTKESLIETALEEIFYEEFRYGFECKDLEGQIIVKELELILFKIKISNTNFKVKVTDNLLKIKEVTFVNSPIVLDFINESPYGLIYHYKDLLDKIKNTKIKSKKYKVNKNIENIIGGKFEFENKFLGRELKFIKLGLVNEIEIINTATGIKSFGILDLLDKSGSLDGDDLLILDEPEVHLHPEWQVKYAELVINLIKERDLSVLITSHSPYLIEALSKFSKNEEVKASFYLSEEDGEGKCIVGDKTEKKYEIFEKLSKPFRDLMLK